MSHRAFPPCLNAPQSKSLWFCIWPVFFSRRKEENKIKLHTYCLRLSNGQNISCTVGDFLHAFSRKMTVCVQWRYLYCESIRDSVGFCWYVGMEVSTTVHQLFLPISSIIPLGTTTNMYVAPKDHSAWGLAVRFLLKEEKGRLSWQSRQSTCYKHVVFVLW